MVVSREQRENILSSTFQATADVTKKESDAQQKARFIRERESVLKMAYYNARHKLCDGGWWRRRSGGKRKRRTTRSNSDLFSKKGVEQGDHQQYSTPFHTGYWQRPGLTL